MYNNQDYFIEKTTDFQTLYKCICDFDECFVPSISQIKKDKREFALKLSKNAITLILKSKGEILGFLSAYMNDMQTNTAFLSLIAVEKYCRKCGLGEQLLKAAEKEALTQNLKYFKLEVYEDNFPAIKFYKKHGFEIVDKLNNNSFYMIKKLEKNVWETYIKYASQ